MVPLEEYIPVPPDGSDGIVYEIAFAEIGRGLLKSTEVDLSRPRWISSSYHQCNGCFKLILIAFCSLKLHSGN